MNLCVEFQPGPPYSLGQLGHSQPLPASFFCHCSSRSLETWLVRLRRLLLRHFRRHVGGDPVAHFALEGELFVVEGKAHLVAPLPLSSIAARRTTDQSPSMTFDMIPRCTSDEPP